jgi:hypothetical protein
MDGDLLHLKNRPKQFRFLGIVTRIQADYCFILLVNTTATIFLHRNICTGHIPFESLALGDYLRFQMSESKLHPGHLVAGHPSRLKLSE